MTAVNVLPVAGCIRSTLGGKAGASAIHHPVNGRVEHAKKSVASDHQATIDAELTRSSDKFSRAIQGINQPVGWG